MNKQELNLLPILLFTILASLFYIDFIKKSNEIVPIEISDMAKPIKENIPVENTEIVVFNPKSLKYHKEYCEWAIKYKRCIKITKINAQNKGGVACKICGKTKGGNTAFNK